MVTTNTHSRLQDYRHNYGLVCITGVLGGRWHRYKQSTRENRTRDFILFALVVMTFLFAMFYFYFWIISRNDMGNLNEFLYQKLEKWIDWYTIFLSLSCVTFAYFIIIMILCFCHVVYNHQLYIHPAHIVVTVLTLGVCIAITVLLDDLWSSEWAVIYLSLQIMGPFLHVGFVTLMTTLSWFIAGQWILLHRFTVKLIWLCVFLSVMAGLYVAPLLIQSPCIGQLSELPSKPKLFAHKGASAIAPENTLAAFQTAMKYSVYGLESDVAISYDGIPYIMHDRKLMRTTNVDEVFPNLKENYSFEFNISQVKQLNAGSWFLETDPYWTAGGLTDHERDWYTNQSVPTLAEVLELINETGTRLMLDLQLPPIDHPLFNTTLNVMIDVILQSGVNTKQIWWLSSSLMNHSIIDDLFTVAAISYYPVSELDLHNISHVNAEYTQLSMDDIRDYTEANISSNIYIVDSTWFYSLYWCLGTGYVTTNQCHILSQLEHPVWHLSDSGFLILWVTIDALSALIIITLFIIQRIRMFGTKFNPETISLQSRNSNASSLTGAYRSNMKEKLLFAADTPEDMDRNSVITGVSNDTTDEIDVTGSVSGSGSFSRSPHNTMNGMSLTHVLDNDQTPIQHTEVKLEMT